MKPDRKHMRLALRLAQRGYGTTSPNPMVGAVLVRSGKIIGRGWHRRAGEEHAEIEALRDAARQNHKVKGATLYVTLEPCCTHGRTPPCTEAIIAAGVRRVVIGATDPNPRHCGKGFAVLKRAGIAVTHGLLAAECERLNEAFNHWIVRRTPRVTVKAAMTLDGKIATSSGESKWITGKPARAIAMNLRRAADAILVGINTVLADDPRLTLRQTPSARPDTLGSSPGSQGHQLRRIILDSRARTPFRARVVSDSSAALTTIVVSEMAPKKRIARLSQHVSVLVAPIRNHKIDLRWLLKKLAAEGVTSLLVEGGGEVNASFLFGGLAQRIAFFYAPKILGGRDSHPSVAGEGASRLQESLKLADIAWKRVGADWFLTARVA